MKFFILFVLIGAACAITAEEQPKKLNLQQVEEMLQQIEKDEAQLKPVVENDPTVTVALEKLFIQFKQLTSAYVDVLNAVNKNLGLPKYPKLPGMYRQRRGIMDSPPIKQIAENLSQIGTSIQEAGSLVNRVVTNVAEDTRKTVLKQFQQFTDLWSNQLNEIARIFEQQQWQGRDEQETVFAQINRHLSQLGRDIQNYVESLLNDIRNRVVGPNRTPIPPRK